jgi:hypothetical protein
MPVVGVNRQQLLKGQIHNNSFIIILLIAIFISSFLSLKENKLCKKPASPTRKKLTLNYGKE